MKISKITRRLIRIGFGLTSPIEVGSENEAQVFDVLLNYRWLHSSASMCRRVSEAILLVIPIDDTLIYSPLTHGLSVGSR